MKIYVLNLETSTDRLEAFTQAYPKCLPPFEVWRAKTPDECEIPGWWRGSPEFFSNAQNVHDVFQTCANGNEDFLFFEDDCVFASDFQEQYERFLAEVPEDWEVLNFCTNHMMTAMYPPERISENVLRPRLGFNTNALLLRPSGAAKMAKQLEKKDWTCKHIAEQMLGYLYLDPEFKVYAPARNFVGQAGCWSELCKRFRDERWYQYERR